MAAGFSGRFPIWNGPDKPGGEMKCGFTPGLNACAARRIADEKAHKTRKSLTAQTLARRSSFFALLAA
jgi:hypothetical protein